MKPIIFKKYNLLFPLVVLMTFILGQTGYSQDSEKLVGEDYVEKVKVDFQNNDWEKGKEKIDEGLDHFPLNSTLYMMKGKYYHHRKNYDKARYNLIKSLQYDPTNVGAKQILVNVEIEAKHYSGAICYLNELLEVTPYWRGLWRKKIHVYRLQGNVEEANRLAKRINQIYPKDTQLKKDYEYNLQTQIADLKRNGKLEDAVQLTKDLLAIDRKNPKLYTTVINTHLSAGDTEQALVYANRAVDIAPNDPDLIVKKASILVDLGRNEEALRFLKMKKGQVTSTKVYNAYNYILSQSANTERQRDPYVLYGKIYARNPNNRMALDYLLNTSLSRGYTTDALYYLKKAKQQRGETKDLLAKEYALQKRLGNTAKANKVLVKLYKDYPNDYDVNENYIAYQYDRTKNYMGQKQYREAQKTLQFLLKQPQNDYTEGILQSAVTVYLELGRKKEALDFANALEYDYPSTSNRIRKIPVLLALERDEDALAIYEDLINQADDADKGYYTIGYEEIAQQYIKELDKADRPDKAYQVAQKMLEVNPESELGFQYAIKYSYELGDKKAFLSYAKEAVIKHPENMDFNTKLAEAYMLNKKYMKAKDLVNPLLLTHSYNKGLINVKSQFALEYGKYLYKKKKSDSLLLVMNDALKYDPENDQLKYNKGLAFQQKKQFDSAYYYQERFYTPSPIEVHEYKRHLNWLKFNTYKNEIAIFHLRSRFSDKINVNAISTIAYTRFAGYNTYAARLNYSGRDDGFGLQPQVEWSHVLDYKTYFTANAAYGSKYFPNISANLSLYRTVAPNYVGEIGIGYRHLPNQFSITNGIIGLTRNWEFITLNGKFTGYVSEGNLFYNFSADLKMGVFGDHRSYLEALAGIGTAPQVQTLDINLYSGLNALNTVVGAGGRYLVTDRLTLGILGTWYNYKDDNSIYRNLYNINLQAYFSF